MQTQMKMEQRLVEARITDIGKLQVLESRIIALEEEDVEVYELSMAQMDSYEIRCRQTLEDLYKDYLISLRQLLPTCRFPDNFFHNPEDPDASGGAGGDGAGLSGAGLSGQIGAEIVGSGTPIAGSQPAPSTHPIQSGNQVANTSSDPSNAISLQRHLNILKAIKDDFWALLQNAEKVQDNNLALQLANKELEVKLAEMAEQLDKSDTIINVLRRKLTAQTEKNQEIEQSVERMEAEMQEYKQLTTE